VLGHVPLTTDVLVEYVVRLSRGRSIGRGAFTLSVHFKGADDADLEK